MTPTLVNLTPHPICLCDDAGAILETVPPSGIVARVTERPGEAVDLGLPVPVQGLPARGPVEGLPEPEPGTGTYYIVSAIVGAAAPRTDVLCPGTGPQDNPVRDASGRILGVRVLRATAPWTPSQRPCACGSGHASPGYPGGCAAGDQFCG
jgi:hypothetical protein